MFGFEAEFIPKFQRKFRLPVHTKNIFLFQYKNATGSIKCWVSIKKGRATDIIKEVTNSINAIYLPSLKIYFIWSRSFQWHHQETKFRSNIFRISMKRYILTIDQSLYEHCVISSNDQFFFLFICSLDFF